MEAVFWQRKERVGKLTDDDLTVIRGRRDQLIGKIQERCGIARQDAEKQVDEFARSFREGAAEERSRGDHEADVHSNVKEKKRGAGQA
jgi:uncharacterized protein YjbJ (UPF0337 family)